jgi:hypothetical protein
VVMDGEWLLQPGKEKSNKRKHWAIAKEDVASTATPLGYLGWAALRGSNVMDFLRALLGNRLVNTYHSNECATIGRPMIGNAWVDTPDNNTWYLTEQLMCFLWVVHADRAYIRSSSVVQWVSSW